MKWVICTFLCLFTAPLSASLQVCISDPNTLEPVDFPEVMVGSYVSLVVHSDANDYRSCGLFIKGQDRATGQLQARDKNPDPNSRDWSGSHLKAAGQEAYVLGWKDSLLWGYDLYPDDFERQAGKWFVIDYYAVDEGLCNVGYYNHACSSWTEPDPNVPELCFTNTPTRDLYPDGYVNFADFAIFSRYWTAENCGDPNNACYQADFSRNGSVGFEDVMMFADFWLHGIPGWKTTQQTAVVTSNELNNIPQTDPNTPTDLIYAIVDVNSLSEITLGIGQSVRLYITKSSISETVHVFDMDAVISDPNLGWIDTTDTAEILAIPRNNYFDYYGSSYDEPDAIQFFAVSIESPMLDGDMASFVYTATQAGDVTLNLVNYASTLAELHSFTIHQDESIVEKLQQIYGDGPELQTEIPEPEWNAFIESVEESSAQRTIIQSKSSE